MILVETHTGVSLRMLAQAHGPETGQHPIEPRTGTDHVQGLTFFPQILPYGPCGSGSSAHPEVTLQLLLKPALSPLSFPFPLPSQHSLLSPQPLPCPPSRPTSPQTSYSPQSPALLFLRHPLLSIPISSLPPYPKHCYVTLRCQNLCLPFLRL